MFCTIEGPTRGREWHPSTLRHSLRRKAERLGIDKRVVPGSFRATYLFETKGLGTIEAEIGAYVDERAFEDRYPEAYHRWRTGLVLYRENAKRNAKEVGWHCREALKEFANALVTAHGANVSLDAGTIDKLRAVFAVVPSLGKKPDAFVRALIAYWGTVADIGERQTHEAQRDKEPLGPEDGRRVVFYTMLVMYEIDRAQVA